VSFQISRTYRFEAAHWLPHVRPGHKCGKVHGHSYLVEICVNGGLTDPEGWVCDFAEIDASWAPVYSRLDHQLLNDIEGLENPTSEIIARWIWRRLPLTGLSAVIVCETSASRCVYRGQ